MVAKNFATMDTRRTQLGAARDALKDRFEQSRIAPFQAPLAHLAPNPHNPRYPDDPQVKELATSFKVVGQLQTATVVTRETFVDAYPDDEDRIAKHAKYVVFIGNRRLAAAQLAGLDSLEVVLDPDVAAAAQIEERILHENIHRSPLPYLMEAERFVRTMEREKLSNRALADRLGVSHAYVNQRVQVLRQLIPEFQDMLRTGDIGFKAAREIAILGKDEQKRRLPLQPLLAKLVPGLQQLLLDGDLDPAEAAEIANETSSRQRSILRKLVTTKPVKTPQPPPTPSPSGNPVSTPAGTLVDFPEQESTAASSNGSSHISPAAVEPGDDSEQVSPNHTESGTVSATQKNTPSASSTAGSGRGNRVSIVLPDSPAGFAELIRTHLDPAAIAKLVSLLTDSVDHKNRGRGSN